MTGIFLKIINTSISASWIVLVVLLLRLLFRKAPKWISVFLWSIVAIRLLCPFSVESALSLIPSAETIRPGTMTGRSLEIDTGIPFLNNAVNLMISGSLAPSPQDSANPLQIWISVFSVVWIIGIAVLLLYAVISYLKVRRTVETAVLLRNNIYQSENVGSPFVLGIIKPRIYLPFAISEQNMVLVIAHEQAHICRRDYFWKPLGFLLLCLHWFNPLMWLGYVLLCRDIELACDEKVVREWSADQRADYSQALLVCSVNQRKVTACPLAFGEVGVKERVQSVLNYKKPAFWVVSVAIILSAVTAICFLTNPKTRQTEISAELGVFLDGQIVEHHRSNQTDGNFIVIDYRILDVENSLNNITVYMWVLYHEYSLKDGDIHVEAGAHTPTAVTVKRSDPIGHFEEHYELVEYWTPRDGSYYADDIKAKFPLRLYGDALDSQKYIDAQEAFCESSAREYYGLPVSDSGRY